MIHVCLRCDPERQFGTYEALRDHIRTAHLKEPELVGEGREDHGPDTIDLRFLL